MEKPLRKKKIKSYRIEISKRYVIYESNKNKAIQKAKRYLVHDIQNPDKSKYLHINVDVWPKSAKDNPDIRLYQGVYKEYKKGKSKMGLKV